MAKYTSKNQIAEWAKTYKDTFVNESKEDIEENDMLKGRVHNGHLNEDDMLDEAEPKFKVDAQYIKTVTDMLKPLQKVDPHKYEITLKYLRSNMGRMYTIDAKEFADKRLEGMNTPVSNDIQTLSTPEDRVGQDEVSARNQALATKNEPKQQTIKSIWVKDMVLNRDDETKSVAHLEIEYMDGAKEQTDFNVGTSGTKGGYENADRLYKMLKRSMPGATDKDIRLSMIRVAFNDYRITWYYGSNKMGAAAWSFDKDVDKAASSPMVKAAKKSWLDRVKPSKAAIWKSNFSNTTIYRTESEEKPEHGNGLDESTKQFIRDFNDKFSK